MDLVSLQQENDRRLQTETLGRQAFSEAFGEYFLYFSLIQNELEENSLILSARLDKRLKVRKLALFKLERRFFALSRLFTYRSRPENLVLIRRVERFIRKKTQKARQIRNQVAHSVWCEAFWEDGEFSPEDYPYSVKIYNAETETGTAISLEAKDWKTAKTFKKLTLELELLRRMYEVFCRSILDHSGQDLEEYFFDKPDTGLTFHQEINDSGGLSPVAFAKD